MFLVPRLLSEVRLNFVRIGSVHCNSLSMSQASGPSLKRAMPMKIGTHSGKFHCDEALGVFLLKRFLYPEAEVVRTRDPTKLAECDIVLDVGGTYDPGTLRFDHHQRGFDESFGNGFETKLSSAGLVYKHFGKQIIAELLGLPVESPEVGTVYTAVYKNFIHGVDAVDNGVNQYETSAQAKYVDHTHLSGRVAALNPRWNDDQSDAACDTGFARAVEMTGADFLNEVDYVSKAWLPARKYVQEAVEGRLQLDPSGQIMKLVLACPWKDHLYDLEAELAVPDPIKFVIYEDVKEKKWRVQAVSVTSESFESRKTLPKAWWGLRDHELSQTSGIPGCVFVHANGFIGGNDTMEGVLEMARQALILP
eukprot:jgi/Botrbrau1/22964/Bobra.0030s0036.1